MNESGQTEGQYKPTNKKAYIRQPQEDQSFSFDDVEVSSGALVTQPQAEDGFSQANRQLPPNNVLEGGTPVIQSNREKVLPFEDTNEGDPKNSDRSSETKYSTKQKDGILRNLQNRLGLSDEFIERTRKRFEDAMPQDLAEYSAKLQIILKLRNENPMSDEMFHEFEAWAESLSIEELANNPNLISAYIFNTIQNGKEKVPHGENKQDKPDERRNPKEAETTARAAELVEQGYKIAAFTEFCKLKAQEGVRIPQMPTLPKKPQHTLENGHPNQNYEQEHDDYLAELQQYEDVKELYDLDMQKILQGFEEHWKDNCLPRIKAEERFIQKNPKPSKFLEDGSVNPNFETENAIWKKNFEVYYEIERNKQLENTDAFDEKGKTFKEQLVKLGLDYLLTVEDVDFITLLKTIFYADALIAGNETLFSTEATDAQAIDVLAFRNLCNWSTSEHDKKSNRKKWARLTGLMLKHLDSAKYQNIPDEWIRDSKIDDDTMQKNMQTLYKEAAKAGKQKVDKAFNDALEDHLAQSHPDALLARPSKKVQVTSELMTHFQVLATDRKHLREFFR